MVLVGEDRPPWGQVGEVVQGDAGQQKLYQEGVAVVQEHLKEVGVVELWEPGDLVAWEPEVPVV